MNLDYSFMQCIKLAYTDLNDYAHVVNVLNELKALKANNLCNVLMLHLVQLIISYFQVIQQVLTEMEPRSNQEEPASASPSACDLEKDEPPLHGVQAAPEGDNFHVLLCFQRSAFLISHQWENRKEPRHLCAPHKGQDRFTS